MINQEDHNLKLYVRLKRDFHAIGTVLELARMP